MERDFTGFEICCEMGRGRMDALAGVPRREDETSHYLLAFDHQRACELRRRLMRAVDGHREGRAA